MPRRRARAPPEPGRSTLSDNPALSLWPGYLAWLPRFLFDTDKVPERYIGKAWLVALLPSMALSALVNLVAPPGSHPSIHIYGLVSVLLMIVIGPILETLLMIPPLLGLNRLFGPGIAVLGSALLWGAAHSLSAPAWGFVVWWPFLILSIALLTWRRAGLGKAILVVFAIHALQNGLAAFTLLMIE
jgi:membrane protease YdiL (CAAX protease family)